MEDFIPISMLNDFIFCPYSIYLHNVYMETDESQYHATPQIKGKTAHTSIDNKTFAKSKGDLVGLSVCSNILNIYGKIDLYRFSTKTLVERKFQINRIFKGQMFQLWAQYYCMVEMGYLIDNLAFYETSTNKTKPIPLPGDTEKAELISFIDYFRSFDPGKTSFDVNINKCRHCIYSNLCDKTDINNVYT